MHHRLQALRWILGAALLSGMALSPHLWTTERAFPTVPMVNGLPDLPHWLAVSLAGLLVLSVIALAAMRTPRRVALVPTVLGLVLILFDITRLQPWFYQYMLMYAAVALVRDDDRDVPERSERSPRAQATHAFRASAPLAACAFIVISLYIWSGVQKANLSFAMHVFPMLIGPLGDPWVSRLQPLWIAAPLFEITAGTLLLCRATRTWGLALLVVMHAAILLALGPLGRHANTVIWPWNVFMPTLAAVLVYRNDQPFVRTTWSQPFGKLLIVLLGLMPALSLVGRWDGPLSASLYSGKLPDAWIYLTERGVAQLPAQYTEHNIALTQDGPHRFRLDVTRWAEHALNVPPYAEPRVYQRLMKKLEAAGVARHDMQLLVRDDPGIAGTARTYSALPAR